ncbi:MAG: NAD(P)H-dependent oxidoreductase subunit E [Anaerolineaceae bacterium]|nr:NAD(P)H-dependent oxidoreductase subunit E [Anaerolineaceae bacterium]
MAITIHENVPTTDPLVISDKREVIDRILETNRDLPGATMVVLNELQSQVGFVSPAMQTYVARRLKVPVSMIHGVISFYSFFTTQPRGKHTIKFCMGTACYVGGAQQLIEKAKQTLGIEPGQTSADGKVTLEICRCVGACSQAPVVVMDEEVIGRAKPNKFPQLARRCQE